MADLSKVANHGSAPFEWSARLDLYTESAIGHVAIHTLLREPDKTIKVVNASQALLRAISLPKGKGHILY